MLENYFAILIFQAYRKVPETSKNATAALTVPTDTPSTNTLDVPNPLANKYIVVNTFYLKFVLLHILLDKSQNCVAGFLLNPHFTPLGTFENFNITISNSNQFIFIVSM